MAAKLAGLTVLVTRPEQQADNLCDLIAQQGGDPVRLPAIDIKAVTVKSWPNVNDYQVIIFVSRNAVSHFVAGLTSPLTTNGLLVAVGKGTAEAMKQHGLSVDVQPSQAGGSEGLLELAELKQISGQGILIVRGVGGRELLADTLTARGAKIDYIELYERCLPTPTKTEIAAALSVDSVVCTSGAGLKNLSLLLEQGITTLLNKPLIVLSERLKQYAASLGFTEILVTTDATDQSIVQRLMELGR